ncbi:MAG: hypothetical protein K2Y21_12835 [Phycisphaerales bacterium]|nr:hypothetical protein [Phycisphaerales bacterium]
MADSAETPADPIPATDQAPATPTPLFICPYCGGPTPDQPRCAQCSGLLDPLSRQATQNAMGPWFIRDEAQPHRPGCSYETILVLIARGKVTLDSVLRGPTTAQFWYPAKRIPGIASKLGVCHACQARVSGEASCPACHTRFEVEGDRQTLGLMPVRMIPTPGSPDSNGSGTSDATPSAAEPRSVAPLTRVMGSLAVPSVAESRLRAELAAARRRSTLLLGVLAVLILVGAIALLATTIAKTSDDGRVKNRAAASREALLDASSPSGAEATPPDPSRSTSPEASPTPNPAMPSESAPAAVPPTAPPTGAAPVTSPKTTDADLQILRRTKLP